MVSGMTKKIVSFRLSAHEIELIEKSARRFKVSRSQALSAAIRAFDHNYMAEDETFVQRTPWWFESLDGDTR